MPKNDIKPLNDRAIEAHEAAGEPKCFECVNSMPDLAKHHAHLLLAYRQSPRLLWQREIERFNRVWEETAIVRDANSVEPSFDQPCETEDEVNCEGEVLTEPDFILRIHTAVIGESVRHLLYSHLGTIDEAEGWEGLKQLLEKHLGGDDGMLQPDYALHFCRITFDLMQGNYILMADIDDDSDVVNIRVIRPCQDELRYPNRFMFFESSAW